LPSEVSGLDEILRGGFLEGGVYIIQGSPGAGKTILANEICFRHAKRGGRAAYVTLLAEMHTRLLQHLRPMAFFDESVIPKSLYYVSAFHTLEGDGLEGLIDVLRHEIKGQHADLLVVDGMVAAQESASTNREFKKFIHELQAHASVSGCTVLLLTSGQLREVSAEHTMVDGVLELDVQLFEFRNERSLLVRKFRGSGYLRGRHTFRITEQGVKFFPRVEARFASATQADVISEARTLGLQVGEAIERGDLEILWQPQRENVLDELAHRLVDAVRRRKVKRLFIDGLGGFLESATSPQRVSRFFSCLTNELRSLGATTVFTMEVPEVVGPVTDRGLIVGRDFAGVEGVTTGIAREPASAAVTAPRAPQPDK
jgi:KaiC/GvpD/RAD55 family RecA-like ATPase